MGKKRKAGKPFGQPTADEEQNYGRSKFDREERFDDSGDEFYNARDKILLDEGPDAKRRRRNQEEDQFLEQSDEEVLGYDSPGSGEEEDEYESEADDSRAAPGEQDDVSDAPRGEEDDDEEVGAWGSSKKDYYNADAIETEADALEEEEEARRLQQRRLQSMTEADFGFDEDEWLESKDKDDEEEEDGGVVTEVLPQLELRDDMSPEERLKIMKSRYPEFEPLAKDFVDLQPVHADLKLAADAAEAAINFAHSSKGKEKPSAPVAVVKLRALSAYLGVISMYFALLSSPSKDADGQALALSAQKLRDHPVMDSLVTCRRMWEKLRNIRVPDVAEIIEEVESEVSENEEAIAAEIAAASAKASKSKEKKQKKTASQKAAESAARRAAKLAQTEANLASLSSLTAPSAATSKPRTKSSSTTAKSSAAIGNTDFGDEDPLTGTAAAEKAARKKSLRFYTSEIAQKSNRRGEAGRNAGGDADIPRRERNKDREQRLNERAEKKGRGEVGAGVELGADNSDDDDGDDRNGRRGNDDDDEYYDMVTSIAAKKKAHKAAAAIAANTPGARVVEADELGPDGKRKITYAIEKNKGLAPKRNKDVRNPRVKKRKKYDEKMKKLGSMRQLYKGGEGRGGYGGELTGIKKNTVRSVKLS